MLKAIIVNKKEYSVDRITKLFIKNGIVEITYSPSAFSSDRMIKAKFKNCEFVDDSAERRKIDDIRRKKYKKISDADKNKYELKGGE